MIQKALGNSRGVPTGLPNDPKSISSFTGGPTDLLDVQFFHKSQLLSLFRGSGCSDFRNKTVAVVVALYERRMICSPAGGPLLPTYSESVKQACSLLEFNKIYTFFFSIITLFIIASFGYRAGYWNFLRRSNLKWKSTICVKLTLKKDRALTDIYVL